jgi:hypothetical protein
MGYDSQPSENLPLNYNKYQAMPPYDPSPEASAYSMVRTMGDSLGRDRPLGPTRSAALLGKARPDQIEGHHYEARAEHQPARPDHIKVKCSLQHPQRRDVGLDAERNRLGDERQRGNHNA